MGKIANFDQRLLAHKNFNTLWFGRNPTEVPPNKPEEKWNPSRANFSGKIPLEALPLDVILCLLSFIEDHQDEYQRQVPDRGQQEATSALLCA